MYYINIHFFNKLNMISTLLAVAITFRFEALSINLLSICTSALAKYASKYFIFPRSSSLALNWETLLPFQVR